MEEIIINLKMIHLNSHSRNCIFISRIEPKLNFHMDYLSIYLKMNV